MLERVSALGLRLERGRSRRSDDAKANDKMVAVELENPV